MASRAQLNVWLEQVALSFARLGLRKRSGADYTRELAPGVLGIVGLGLSGAYQGEASLFPVVGVNHNALERLYVELTRPPAHRYRTYTDVEPLERLMLRDYPRHWHIDRRIHEPELIEALAWQVEQYGIPFIKSIGTLDGQIEHFFRGKLCWNQASVPAIIAYWTAKYRDENELSFALPVAHWVAGDPAAAEAILNDAIIRLGARQSGNAGSIRQFARQFRARIADTPG